MNLSTTITPKSDQLNADDLIAGPRVIRITEVRAGSSPEQPVSIYYDGDNGRPYKPCKSMRRVLVALWGDNGAQYVGRSLQLYRDPSVRFGADETGGIRISHASHIEQAQTMALTVTRGKRKPYRIEVLQIAQQLPDVDAQTIRDVATSKASGEEVRNYYKSLSTATRAQIASSEWKKLADDADARKGAA